MIYIMTDKVEKTESKDDTVEKSNSSIDLLTTIVQKQDKQLEELSKAQQDVMSKLDDLSKAVDSDKSIKPEHGMELKPKTEGDNVGDKTKAPNEVAPDDRHGIKPETGKELTSTDGSQLSMETKADEKKEEMKDNYKKEDKKEDKVEKDDTKEEEYKDKKREDIKKSEILKGEYDYKITHTVKPFEFVNKSEGAIPTGYQIMQAMFNGYAVNGVKKCVNVSQVHAETLSRLHKGDFGTGLPQGDAYLI